jgi:hypothetical protein
VKMKARAPMDYAQNQWLRDCSISPSQATHTGRLENRSCKQGITHFGVVMYTMYRFHLTEAHNENYVHHNSQNL